MFFLMAEQLAEGRVAEVAVQAIRLGRLTALRKPGGGVRRLTSRTMAQQLGEAVKLPTSPFQFALSTRAGCECIAYTLQALEANPEATNLSVDRIGASDLVSWSHVARTVPSALPFVRQLYGNSSRCVWEVDSEEVHETREKVASRAIF